MAKKDGCIYIENYAQARCVSYEAPREDGRLAQPFFILWIPTLVKANELLNNDGEAYFSKKRRRISAKLGRIFEYFDTNFVTYEHDTKSAREITLNELVAQLKEQRQSIEAKFIEKEVDKQTVTPFFSVSSNKLSSLRDRQIKIDMFFHYLDNNLINIFEDLI
jgi:hypothetical protein